MNSWHSYPSIYNLGHAALNDLLKADVIVEEKVDGSQFSFGYFPGNPDYPLGLRVRSKGTELHIDAPEKMFTKAVGTVKVLHAQHGLTPGWTYRGEYLAKPKHNTLAYDRVPDQCIILFDINTGEEAWLPKAEQQAEAVRLGLEFVPTLYVGKVDSLEQVRGFLDRGSVLGGQKIEGVVIKQLIPTLYGRDKKTLIGKFVSEAFKEVHAGEWKVANPTRSDIVQMLVSKLTTPARWAKAVQHVAERGLIEDSPRDIPFLIKEVQADVFKEHEEEVKAALWKHAWPQIERGLTRGLPEWYKEQLLKKQFNVEV